MGAMAGDHRRALGRRGEDLAAVHLERQGWRIVERNFRTREGEIDLIAARRGTLAFCEVKTLIARRAPPASGPADPVESVGPAKRIRVRRMARAWLADGGQRDRPPRHRCVRLDVIGVLLAPDGTLLRLEHLESAF
jgi:putative endonuclease